MVADQMPKELKVFFRLIEIPKEIKKQKKSEKRISLVSKRFSILQKEYEQKHGNEEEKNDFGNSYNISKSLITIKPI